MLARAQRLASTRRFPLWRRLGLVPLVAAIVLVGIWVSGGLLTNNFRLSMLFTTLWLALVGVMALAVSWRWRPLALPVLGTAFVTAAAAGGFLLYASSVDKVVNEQVAVAGSPPGAPAETKAGESREPAAPAGNVALARGSFTSGEHGTSGKATLIRLAKGRTVLTLTGFETSPGPDLRVYLVTGGPDDLGQVVDLGGLKGNKGNQQYDVSRSFDRKRHRTVVIWCRAFSVAFGSARLA